MDFTSLTSKRRHTLPCTSFVDPAIVRFIEKAASTATSTATSIIQDSDDEEEDDQRTTISTVSLPPQLEYHHSPHNNHKQSNLDQLWSRQEKYDNLELRLTALEVTRKRFEHRLQALEAEKTCCSSTSSATTILLQQQQPMKPDQQLIHLDTTTTTAAAHDLETKMMVTQHPLYIQLLEKHNSLLSKHNNLQNELKEKEQRIQDLLTISKQQQQTRQKKEEEEEEEEEASYKEEDGYLIFDTTNMNGEIIHCKVKIPPVPLVSPPATRVGSPQYYNQQQTLVPPTTPLPINYNRKKNKSNTTNGLNFYAPEWKLNK